MKYTTLSLLNVSIVLYITVLHCQGADEQLDLFKW